MKTTHKLLMATVLVIAFCFSSEAQINVKKLGSQVKRSAEQQVEQKVKEKTTRETHEALNKGEKNLDNAVSKASASKPSSSGEVSKYANALYVSTAGTARGEGTKASPLKDVQKAIDKASNGDVIRISEGNFLGNLDRGWMEIKDKYVSLEGGWNSDFTERNPVKYITRIQPTKAQAGTIGSHLLNIEVTSNRHSQIIIDGIFFDYGFVSEYNPADPSDPRFGAPEGCETGLIKPVGVPPNKAVRLIGGKVAGKLIIRNCMFLNGTYNAIIMSNAGGDWEIYNNVFVSNIYSSVQINAGLNQQTNAHESTVDFHHNTVLFTWTRTKEMEDMGYGYRFSNGVDHKVHHNVFGCNNLGALDGTFDDSTLPESKRKICSAYDNLFFMNKGDIVLSGTSGGKWLYVPGKRFDEVEMLKEFENNRELPANSKFKDFIEPAYLKGFASLKIMTTENYDANSAANLYREAHGLNKRGTSTTRVSMFGNRYNFDEAIKLFGAEQGYGAQMPK